MAMNPATRRRLSIALVVGGASLIVWRLIWPPENESDLGQPTSELRARPGSRVSSPTTVLPTELRLAQLDALRAPAAGGGGDAPAADRLTTRLFAPQSWQPTAPPPLKPPTPPPPQAPPFPYAYFGGLTDAGVRTVYFSKAGQVLAVRVGDVVDSRFRIDAIDAQHVTMTYLPLEQSLQIQTGSRQ